MPNLGEGEVCPAMSNLAINVPKIAKGQTDISIKMQNSMCCSAKIQKQKRFNPHRRYYH